jgi:hypothetical protein
MDPAQGRGWAVVQGDELHGMIFFHGVSVGLKVGHFVGQDESASRLPDDICLPLDW